MIVREGVRLGAVTAAFFAGSAVLSAYLPLWLADHGFAADSIGRVLGAASLARVVAVPAIGWAADRFGAWRGAMVAAGLAAALSAAALPAAGGVLQVASLVVLGGIAVSALGPLADAATLALAGAGRLDYGRTRAWGSVAYMVATAAAGALLGRVGSGAVPALLAACFSATGALALAVPSVKRSVGGSWSGGLRLPPSFLRVLLASALIQGSHAAYYGFASLHWRRAGLTDGAIGLLIAEGIVAEIALFVWGRRLIEWLGPARLTALAACGAVARWVGLSLTVWVPALAALQLLHAASFACQHLSSMLVLRTVPPRRAGVAQTLLAALGFSAPTGVLIWLSGAVYGWAGGGVFLLMAAVAAAALPVSRRLPSGQRRG